MTRAFLAAASALLLASPALAEESAITSEVSSGLSVIGPSRNLTGGMVVRGLAEYSFPLSSRVELAPGVNFAVHGMGGGARATGFFGGPTVRISARPWESQWHLSLTTGFDFGRFAQCPTWNTPICPRMVGFDPAFRFAAGYRTESGPIVSAYASARVMPTPIALTVGGEFGLSFALAVKRKR